jgi:hypothetical protein
MTTLRIALPALALFAVACGDGDDGGIPADFAGDSTLAITNGENGCSFETWEVGDTATGIPFTITQSESHVTGNVQGLVAGYLDIVLGGHTFTGDVAGSNARMTLYGSRSVTQGSCTWTVNATVDADIAGDVITGEIDYTAATNGAPDCGAREGCHTLQHFNGTRPPPSS